MACRSLPVLLLALTAACVGPGTRNAYPSLQPRDIEKQPVLAPDVDAPTAAAADPAMVAALRPLVAQAEEGQAQFAVLRQKAEAAAGRARGANQGSEAWIDAQQALSALGSQRGAVQDVAARLDTMLHDPANAAAGRSAAIIAAQARVEAIRAEEDAAVAALAARLD